MRESNFAFPAQNKACVCITSQLYDRRALDTSSALPLFNSLQHLTYLTSTSPRIREIMTMDGGLERLVRILHDFCLAPPPLASPAAFYGLLPPSYHAPRPPSQLNPPAGQFDKYAASRFSLAFKCVVNIGVRGSEPIRSRVVQAGTLDVVGCILEAWLAGRGFAVGPSTSATGLPRETREARAARRAAAAAGRLRADPERPLAITTADSPSANIPRPGTSDDVDLITPIVRDRSATVVVRRRPDGTHHAREPTAAPAPTNSLHSLHAALQHVRPALPPASPSTSSATSTTSARGSPISHSGPGTSSRASPVSSRASPVSAASSRPSSRASPSPSPSETDGDVEGDVDGDVEMVAAGVAGLGVSALRGAEGTRTLPHMLHGRGRVGDSSASASPSPPPLNMAQEEGRGGNMATMTMAGMLNANIMGLNANLMGMMGMGMDGMGLMGLNRDPRIAGEEGMGMGIGINGVIGGDEAMGIEGDAGGMMLNMGMINTDLDAMGMLGAGMGMMNPNMMGMNGGMGMNMGGLGMMGGMPLPRGMGDVSGSGGGDSEPRADTDDSDTGTSAAPTSVTRRRADDDPQTQTPRAGVVRLPSPASESPAVGSSSLGYEEDEADLDEEEGEVVVAVLGGGNGSGTMRRAGTVRGPSRPALPEASTSMSTLELRSPGTATIGRTHSHREPLDNERQSAGHTPSTPADHQPTPGAPRVPPPLIPTVQGRRATAVVTPEVSATATGPSVPPRAREREDREERHHHHHHHAHGHSHQTGPYRDDDVLLSLQLLAYLSKYPHVRQAFYKRRNGFHPASALAVAAAQATEPPEPLPKAPEIARDRGRQSGNGQHSFLRAFGAGKEKEKGKAPLPRSTTSSAPIATAKPSTSTPAFETNVFSLVERFTFRPSSSETDLPNPPPRLPQEIQYWAGVIMRNACRKDDSRGGIRQCARMLCGRWEEYPREFAKCRRCRKAKYCGKECQSTAWSEGHRFWCSAKEGDDAPDSTAATAATSTLATSVSNATIVPDAPEQAAMLPVGAERRERRERNAARERERLVSATTAHPNTVAGTAAPSAESTRTRAMALLRRAANPGAQDAAAPGHLHHPQPQNPADIDRYLANFASRPDEGSEHEMSLD